jgi:hypothetical protein
VGGTPDASLASQLTTHICCAVCLSASLFLLLFLCFCFSLCLCLPGSMCLCLHRSACLSFPSLFFFSSLLPSLRVLSFCCLQSQHRAPSGWTRVSQEPDIELPSVSHMPALYMTNLLIPLPLASCLRLIHHVGIIVPISLGRKLRPREYFIHLLRGSGVWCAEPGFSTAPF